MTSRRASTRNGGEPRRRGDREALAAGAPSEADPAIEATIAKLGADEIASALHAAKAPWVVREALARLVRGPSGRLGRILAGFDAAIEDDGLERAARAVLTQLGAVVDVDGAIPKRGPVLVVTNHPGAYDAFALMTALRRDDLAFVASDRAFLRALPHLSERLVLIADESAGVLARARGLRRALERLGRGEVLIQFGAGAIEPDARFARGVELLGRWNEGTGLLAHRAAREGATIVPCFVAGVHSPRAKRLPFVRWAERRGVTTIAPLLQATLPGFRDVVVTVAIGEPIDRGVLLRAEDDRTRTEILRQAVLDLANARAHHGRR